MNDWQMKEYNELRLEKIDQEYEKYINWRAYIIVKKYAFENSMSSPYLQGYQIDIESIVFNGNLVEVGFNYQDYGDYFDEFNFPVEWFFCKEEKLLNEIVRAHIENYQAEQEEERKRKEKDKESEIKALEEKLSKLKGIKNAI